MDNHDSKSSKSKQNDPKSEETKQSWCKAGACSEKGEEFCNYVKSHKCQAGAYGLLIVGVLLLLLGNHWLGGLILGAVTGYYFASDIVYYLRNLKNTFSGQEQVRYVILSALLLGLFIAVPGIFIGAVVVATLKQVISGTSA